MRTTVSTLLVSLLSANAVAAQHAMPATPPAAETPAVAQPAVSAANVARAQFTSAVQDREPVDSLDALTNDVERVFFFTELRGLGGQRVTHRWEHGGKVMGEVAYEVGGDRWRVWSSKQFDPSWTGEWKVSVIDASGATLATQTLSYAPAAPPAAPAATKPN